MINALPAAVGRTVRSTLLPRVKVTYGNPKKTSTNLIAARISHLPTVMYLALIELRSANARKDGSHRLTIILRVCQLISGYVSNLTPTCRTIWFYLPKPRWQTMRPASSLRTRQIYSNARSFGMYLPRFASHWTRNLLRTAESLSP